MSTTMTTKWCTVNLPMIIQRRTDDRLYLTKRELVELRDDITEFINYYSAEFSEDQLDINFWPDAF